jgi:peptide/nickel transport system substrate-binding protein
MAPQPTEAPAEPKILRVRNETDITNLDPAFWPSTNDVAVMTSIYEGLVGYVPGTWEVKNYLAESIEQVDPLTIDFKLKEGIQFHGGYGEMTAEDVKFTFERLADPALDAVYAGDWATLDHVEVTGTYTGQIILKEPFAALWTTTLPMTSGWIMSKRATEELGDEHATHPIGTGPYEFAEWTPDQQVVLKRFAGYWGEPGEWDEIHVIPIPEDSAAEIALETGEIDYGTISTGAIERFETSGEFEVYPANTLGYTWVAMNVQHPNLQDKNLREAIRYAIDVPAIIEAAYDGRVERACSLVAPGQLGYWADAPCYERDLDKAAEFLAQVPEVPELTLTTLDAEQEKAATQVIQSNLAEIGISVEIIVQDGSAFWDGGMGEAGLQDRQLTYISYANSPDPSWATVWFTCDQIGQWNWMYWCDEQFDQLHFEALKELDTDKRADMYLEMQQLWDEAAHTVWIAYPTLYFASRADLDPGITPHSWLLPYATTSK